MRLPSRSAESFELARGVVAIAPGLAWLPASRSVLVADAHLAYEDVVGGALPLWSTAEIVATLALVAERMAAREIVFLGDIVHGAHMSEGAMRTVRDGLDLLRSKATVTLVAGNHEGRSRAFAVLGATVEACERDGWLLVHGDRPSALGQPVIIGHLHPSLRLGNRSSAPAFVASANFVVVPALTPYSDGLEVRSRAFADAIGAWSIRAAELMVVVAASDCVYPFGALEGLREALRSSPAPPRRTPAAPYRRRRLGPG